MATGIRVWDATGRLIFTSENVIGGVYVGRYSQSQGAGTWVFDGSDSRFPDIGPLRIRAVQFGAGAHNWEISGSKVINFTAKSLAGNTLRTLYSTTLVIFAI